MNYARFCSIIFFIFYYFQVNGQSSKDGFTLLSNNFRKIEINKSFSETTEFNPFDTIKGNIFGLAISADIEFDDDGSQSLVRVILYDKEFKEHLVYETYNLLESGLSFTVNNIAEETIILDGIQPENLILEIQNAHISLRHITYVSERNSGIEVSKAQNEGKTERIADKVRRLNENIKRKGLKWVAGPTSVSHLTYQKRKQVLGNGDVPPGIEFYKGGIFTISKSQALKSTASSPFIDVWDWRDRHGKNWVTPVTNQLNCGSCWAFAVTGAVETMANLFFNNEELDLDLAEQDVLSCSGSGSCSGGYTSSAMDYIVNNGIVDEASFPYSATDESCSNKSTNPSELIRIAGRVNIGEGEYLRTIDGQKKMLIEMGPTASSVSNWSHAMVLVGYHTVSEGDSFYYSDGNNSSNHHDITIEAGDPLIGTTLWIFKNSWGSGWGDGGYSYFEVNINELYSRGIITPVTSELVERNVAWSDNDGDGYYWWGLGEKPLDCPGPELADGNDNDATLGPVNEYGYCTILDGPPVADFTATPLNVIEGDTVNFTDLSSSNTISRNWIFEGGIPSSSTEENPSIIYSNSGIYDITLIASNEDGADTVTKVDYIEVLTDPCVEDITSFPYNEQFVTGDLSLYCWEILDNNGSGQNWIFDNPGNRTINTSTANNGFAILDSDNFGSGNTQNSDLVSPVFDFTGYTNITVQFEHFFREYSGETATFFYSLDNGSTWTELQTWTSSISNATLYSEDLTLILEGESQVRFKWNYTGTWGWYWAVDDFMVTADENYPIPVNLLVSDTALVNEVIDCFNATNTINVAGDGTNVIVESGASADFIAGQSIRFLPGFHSHEGSYAHGYITETGDYCVEAAPAIVAEEISTKEAVIVDAELTEIVEREMVVYPNPNSGEFTVEFRNFEGETRLMLFNFIGQLVHDELTIDREIRMNVPNAKSGLYFIKAVNNNEHFSQKIIVH